MDSTKASIPHDTPDILEFFVNDTPHVGVNGNGAPRER